MNFSHGLAPHPRSTATPLSRFQVLKLLMGLLRQQPFLVLLGLLGLLAGVMANLSIPLLIEYAIGSGLSWTAPGASTSTQALELLLASDLFRVIVASGGLFIAQGLAFFLRSLAFGALGHKITHALRVQLFQTIMQQPLAELQQDGFSRLASAISSDLSTVQDIVGIKLSVLVRYSLQVLIGIAAMIYLSPLLALGIVAGLPILALISSVLARAMRAESRLFQSYLARTAATAQTAIFGARFTKAHGLEHAIAERVNVASTQAQASGIRRTAWGAVLSSGMSLLLNLLLVGLIAWGVTLVRTQHLSIGELAAFIAYSVIVAVSFAFIAHAIADFIQALGSAGWALQKIVSPNATQQSPLRGALQPDFSQPITLSAVSKWYSSEGAGLVALKAISCSFAPGTMNAIVGYSGSGKTTLVSMLLGLLEANEGQILLGQIPYADLDHAAFHRGVGYVPQEPFLIPGTLKENITFAAPQIKDQEIIALCEAMQLGEFFSTSGKGLETDVGQLGLDVSGGQRQRIALVCALARNPKLLVLDEATAALDGPTERAVLAKIRELLPAATIIIISHRVQTLLHVDQVVVIDRGQIREQGSPQQLLNQKGLFSILASV